MNRKQIWALGLGVFAVLFSGTVIVLNVVFRQMSANKDREVAKKISEIKTSVRKEE